MRYFYSLLFLLVTSTASAESMQTAIDSATWFPVSNLQRTPLAEGVVHYSAVIKIGSGTHDKIRLHRITKENSAWHAKPTSYSVFAAHGDNINSVPSFAVGPNSGSITSSLAYELAKAGIDVWMIDQRWSLVPAGVIDPNVPSSDDFMAGWGLDRQIADTEIGIGIARLVRAATGSDGDPMPFLGYSAGGITGYAVAEYEATLPAWARQVSALLILEVPYKTNIPSFAATICGIADGMDAAIAAGTYFDSTGTLIATAASLAETNPAGASPFFPPGVTNLDAIRIVGTLPSPQPYLPHYHLIGGEFVNGFPVDTLFTGIDTFIDTAKLASPYEPLPLMRDMRRNLCADTKWDDHLNDITVPVLGVFAEGGFGSTGLYTLDLLGTAPSNIDTIVISETGDPFTDFGHGDVTSAALAKTLWWNAAIAWLKSL